MCEYKVVPEEGRTCFTHLYQHCSDACDFQLENKCQNNNVSANK